MRDDNRELPSNTQCSGFDKAVGRAESFSSTLKPVPEIAIYIYTRAVLAELKYKWQNELLEREKEEMAKREREKRNDVGRDAKAKRYIVTSG